MTRWRRTNGSPTNTPWCAGSTIPRCICRNARAIEFFNGPHDIHGQGTFRIPAPVPPLAVSRARVAGLVHLNLRYHNAPLREGGTSG